MPVAFAKITEVKAYGGTDSIPNLVRQTDFIKFTVKTDTELEAENILMNDIPFDICSGMECQLLYPKEGVTEFPPVFGYTIRMFDDQVQGSVYSDILGPEITSVKLKEQTAEKITFDITVKDYTYLRTDTEVCAGIAIITAMEAAPSKAVSPKGCKFGGVIEFANTFPDGPQTLTFVAFDKFGQQSTEKKVRFTVDKTPPEFVEGSAKLLDAVGRPVTMIKGIGSMLMLEIRVKGNDIEEVTADLSDFGLEGRKKGDCREGKCSWEVQTYIEGSGVTSISVPFTATDINKNTAEFSGTIQIEVDNEGPSFSTIEGPTSSSGQLVLGRETTLAVLVGEASSYNPKDIKLDLSGLGGGVISADSCSNGKCYFKIPIALASGTRGTIRTSLDSADAFGNLASNSVEIQVTVDTDDPEFLGYSYTPKFPTIKEGVQLVINITELTTMPRVAVDASGISDEIFPEEMQCALENSATGLWQCSLQIGNLKNINAKESIKLTIFDEANNTVKQEVEMEIFEYDGEVEPDVFSASQNPLVFPKSVDRLVSSQIENALFIYPILRPKVPDAEVLQMGVDCSESQNLLVSRGHLLNDDTLEPIIVADTNPETFGKIEQSSAKIKCKLMLYVKGNGKVYEKPQEEDVEGSFGLYNYPLGYIDEGIQEKIDGLKGEVRELDDRMGTRKTADKALETMCSIVKPINQLNNLLQALSVILQGISCGLSSVPLTKGAGISLWSATCFVVRPVGTWTRRLVWDPAPIPEFTTILGWMNKWACNVHECRFCDPYFLMDTVRSFTNTGLEALGAYEGLRGIFQGEEYEQAQKKLSELGKAKEEAEKAEKTKEEAEKEIAEKEKSRDTKIKEMEQAEKKAKEATTDQEKKSAETTAEKARQDALNLEKEIMKANGIINEAKNTIAKLGDAEKAYQSSFKELWKNTQRDFLKNEVDAGRLNAEILSAKYRLERVKKEGNPDELKSAERWLDILEGLKSGEELDMEGVPLGELMELSNKVLAPIDKLNPGQVAPDVGREHFTPEEGDKMAIPPSTSHNGVSLTSGTFEFKGGKWGQQIDSSGFQEITDTSTINALNSYTQQVRDTRGVYGRTTDFMTPWYKLLRSDNKLDLEPEDIPPTWWRDPYKSIHNAENCYCNSGIIFAYEKEKRIKCAQIKCIEEVSKAGLPITLCEESAKARRCMYVTGAPWKVFGDQSDFFGDLADSLQKNMADEILGVIGFACSIVGYEPLMTCATDIEPCSPKTSADTFCYVVNAAQGIKSYYDVVDNGFVIGSPEKDLGPDTCEGIEGI